MDPRQKKAPPTPPQLPRDESKFSREDSATSSSSNQVSPSILSTDSSIESVSEGSIDNIDQSITPAELKDCIKQMMDKKKDEYQFKHYHIFLKRKGEHEEYYISDDRDILGEGSFAQIYTGALIDAETGEYKKGARDVAIKYFKAKLVDRQNQRSFNPVEMAKIMNEAIPLEEYSDPTAKLLTFDDHCVIISKFIADPDLVSDKFVPAEILVHLTFAQRIGLIIELLTKLKGIHRTHIHCDIKGANIKIVYNSKEDKFSLIILDYGQALPAPKDDSLVPIIGHEVGSPGHFTKECVDYSMVGKKSDLSACVPLIDILLSPHTHNPYKDKFRYVDDPKKSDQRFAIEDNLIAQGFQFRKRFMHEVDVNYNFDELFEFKSEEKVPENIKKYTRDFLKRMSDPDVPYAKRPNDDEAIDFFKTIQAVMNLLKTKENQLIINQKYAKLAIMASGQWQEQFGDISQLDSKKPEIIDAILKLDGLKLLNDDALSIFMNKSPVSQEFAATILSMAEGELTFINLMTLIEESRPIDRFLSQFGNFGRLFTSDSPMWKDKKESALFVKKIPQIEIKSVQAVSPEFKIAIDLLEEHKLMNTLILRIFQLFIDESFDFAKEITQILQLPAGEKSDAEKKDAIEKLTEKYFLKEKLRKEKNKYEKMEFTKDKFLNQMRHIKKYISPSLAASLEKMANDSDGSMYFIIPQVLIKLVKFENTLLMSKLQKMNDQGFLDERFIKFLNHSNRKDIDVLFMLVEKEINGFTPKDQPVPFEMFDFKQMDTRSITRAFASVEEFLDQRKRFSNIPHVLVKAFEKMAYNEPMRVKIIQVLENISDAKDAQSYIAILFGMNKHKFLNARFIEYLSGVDKGKIGDMLKKVKEENLQKNAPTDEVSPFNTQKMENDLAQMLDVLESESGLKKGGQPRSTS